MSRAPLEGPQSLPGSAAYIVARFVIWLTAKLYWRVEVTGGENVPKSGPFLLCPVHRSNIDGPLTAIFTRRHMRYLSKDSMFKFAPLGRLFMSMGAIPVNRGVPDRQSLKICTDVLNAGHPLVLFPEGGRRDGPVVEKIQEGAVYLAAKTGVPIVPVGIDGSEAANPRGTVWLKPVKLKIVIGEAMKIDKPEGSDRVPRSAIHEGSEELKRRLQTLFDQAAGRVSNS